MFAERLKQLDKAPLGVVQMQSALLAFCRQKDSVTVGQFVPSILRKQFQGVASVNSRRIKAAAAVMLVGFALLIGAAVGVPSGETGTCTLSALMAQISG